MIADKVYLIETKKVERILGVFQESWSGAGKVSPSLSSIRFISGGAGESVVTRYFLS